MSTVYQLIPEQPATMSANQNSSFIAEMELKSFKKLSPEERKKEARRKMHEELRAVEMERRERAMEKLKKEREEREQVEERARSQREKYLEERRIQEAKQRVEEERKTNELKALQKAEQELLKQKWMRWKKVKKVEESGERSRYTTSTQKEEQQERQEKAGPYPLLKVGGRARRDLLTLDMKTPQHQGRKKPLINNWVGEQKKPSTTDGEKPDPLKSTHPLLAPQEAPKAEGIPHMHRAKPKEPKGKKDEKRERKAEEQYARWTAFKARQASRVSQQNNFYTGGFSANRNSILKSLF